MSDYTPTRGEILTALVVYRAIDGADLDPPNVTEIAEPEDVARYYYEAERGLAEIERAAAEKALTDLAAKIEATARRTDNTFTEHAVVEAGGLELLREAAVAYRQESKGT